MIFGVARRYIVRGQNQRDTRIFAVLCLFWLRDVSSARRVATCVYSDGFEYSKQMAQYHCWQRNKSKRKKKKAFNKVVRWIIDFVAPKDMRSRFCFFCLGPLTHALSLYLGVIIWKACRSSSSKEKVQLTLISRKELSVS